MGIEQTKTPSAPQRSHGTARATDTAKPSATGSMSGTALDFASVLASADETDITPAVAVGALDDVGKVPSNAVQSKPSDGKHRASPGRDEPAQPKAESPTQDASVSSSSSGTGVDEETASDAPVGSIVLPEQPASVQGLLDAAIPTQGIVAAPVQGSVLEANVAVVRSNAGGVKGLASTQLLQQSGAPGAAPKAIAKGLDTLSQGVATSGQGIATSIASQRMGVLHDLATRSVVAGMPESASPPLVMELMGSIMARHQAQSELREGKDALTNVGTAACEATASNPPELVDWTGGGQQAEELVSEPVRFWMGVEQTQLADMTVDDVGGGSVDVTIRLQGKEAHVAFRADESLARDAIQSGSGQLKELLSREGLTLSGLSVGTSADNGTFTRDGYKQGQADVMVAKRGHSRSGGAGTDPVAGVSVSRQGATGRGVDLYV